MTPHDPEENMTPHDPEENMTPHDPRFVAVADLERVVREMVRHEVRCLIDARSSAPDVNYITLSQWAHRNGVSYSYARQRVSAGDLEVVRFGRAVRVAPDAKLSPRPTPTAV